MILLRHWHIRDAKLCMDGARVWFRQRGWPWGKFVAEGRPIQDFVETGCPLAARAVAVAEKEASRGN